MEKIPSGSPAEKKITKAKKEGLQPTNERNNLPEKVDKKKERRERILRGIEFLNKSVSFARDIEERFGNEYIINTARYNARIGDRKYEEYEKYAADELKMSLDLLCMVLEKIADNMQKNIENLADDINYFQECAQQLRKRFKFRSADMNEAIQLDLSDEIVSEICITSPKISNSVYYNIDNLSNFAGNVDKMMSNIINHGSVGEYTNGKNIKFLHARDGLQSIKDLVKIIKART